MKEGIFVGAQIKHLFAHHDFITELNATERRAWEAFENLYRNFLSNETAEKLQSNFAAANCIIQFLSLKLHILHNHFDFYPENTISLSDEHKRMFHQDISHFWLTAAGVFREIETTWRMQDAKEDKVNV
jgi:hypothetical protein